MRKSLIAAAAFAAATIGTAELANAGVVSASVSGLRNTPGIQLAEKTGWNRHKRHKHWVCNWYHGRKHCHWRWW
jgi:hypothetical protein